MKLRAKLYECRRILAEIFHHRWYRLVGPVERAMARRRQQRFCRAYVAVTGSSGKSTTSHLLAQLLPLYGATRSGTPVNLARAVFRTLRKLDAPVDYVVQEISAHGGPGSLKATVEAIRVDVGVVTAVNREHRTRYDDVDAIAREKSELVRRVHPGGLSCLNADDPLVRAMADVAGGRVVLYGTGPDAELRAEAVASAWPARLSFDLVVAGTRRRVTTGFAGPVMLPNVLAALAVIHGLGLDLGAAIAQLATIEAVFEHMSIHPGRDGHTYLLDSYKAPMWASEGFAASLSSFSGVPSVLIVSDLSDRYGDAGARYRRLLRIAASHVGTVLALGMAADYGTRLKHEGIGNLVCLANWRQAVDYLATLPPSLVIIKANERQKLSRIWLAQERQVACQKQICQMYVACANCRVLEVTMQDNSRGRARQAALKAQR